MILLIIIIVKFNNIVMVITQCPLFSHDIALPNEFVFRFQNQSPFPSESLDNSVNVIKYLHIFAEHNIVEMFLRAKLLVRYRWKSAIPSFKCSGFKF